ncbi:MAG: hypothetical protein P1V13_11745 [Rhizobiaceae bacterium]|nr:hypothetical protein [Rhizobiaceae bacterium]
MIQINRLLEDETKRFIAMGPLPDHLIERTQAPKPGLLHGDRQVRETCDVARTSLAKPPAQ